MPVKIPDALPATKVLTEENIFVMTEKRSQQQDIRPLQIAILNLMPTKEQTEIQLLRLIGNTPLQVDVTLLHTATYHPKHADSAHLASFYKTLEDVQEQYFDGVIITGAPVEQMDFDDVAYWQELKRVFAWADSHAFSTLCICWAAQASLYYHYGIGKVPLKEKLFGVYEYTVQQKCHPLMRGFDDCFLIPASRHSAVDEQAVYACPDLLVLVVSAEAGIGLIADTSGRRIYATGHSEYDADTLGNEYLRDVGKGLSIAVPKNYYENDDPKGNVLVRWRSSGNLLFSNWLNYFVYQETPFDIEDIPRQWPQKDVGYA